MIFRAGSRADRTRVIGANAQSGFTGDVVFVKASRSVGLENFAAAIQEEGPARPAG